MARSRLRENIAEEERSTSKPSHLWDMGEQVENRVDCWGRRGELRHEGEGGEMEMEVRKCLGEFTLITCEIKPPPRSKSSVRWLRELHR